MISVKEKTYRWNEKRILNAISGNSYSTSFRKCFHESDLQKVYDSMQQCRSIEFTLHEIYREGFMR